MKTQAEILIDPLSHHLLGDWKASITQGNIAQLITNAKATPKELTEKIGSSFITVLVAGLSDAEMAPAIVLSLRTLLRYAVLHELTLLKSKSAGKTTALLP